MEQLIVDIHSREDARLIKELLKRFKSVDVMSFSSSLSQAEMNKRIRQGLKDADEGKVKPWKEVRGKLMKKIKSNGMTSEILKLY